MFLCANVRSQQHNTNNNNVDTIINIRSEMLNNNTQTTATTMHKQHYTQQH
jgi:hypothetical protein